VSSAPIRTALLFGGRSAEHEVSILSARSVLEAAPRSRLEVVPIAIARDGRFAGPERSARILEGAERADTGDADFAFESWARTSQVQVAFPLVHGTGGEDGSLQGYFETIGIPYVGSGVAASAVGMDKAHMKQAFAAAKLPIVDYVSVHETEWKNERERVSRAVANTLRLPYFVKPSNTGSSVGISKVKSEKQLAAAVDHAFRFDEKILFERGVDAREMEVGLLGHELPEASVVGEIVPAHEFYDYEDKYADGKASLAIPAKMPKEKSEEIRRLAVAAFRSIGASGFARVDFFLERGTSRLYVNEINTIPGFTRISMFPKLWEATEVKYSHLIERLIELGLERWKSRQTRLESTMKWFEEARRLT
jgi:D-alanine-D-alanine ligase